MALYLKNEDWRLIAEEISKETDPVKLTALVAQLCHSLDERQKKPQLLRDQKPFRDVA